MERIYGLESFILILILALGAAVLLNFVMPNSLAEFRWDGLSFKGVAPFGAFVLVFVGGIRFISSSYKIPVSTLLTAGIKKPASVEEIEHSIKKVEIAKIEKNIDALRSLLREHDEIVLVEKLGKPEGIITTADVALRPSEKIEDMITPWNKVVKIHENASLYYAQESFREHSRIPIIDDSGFPRGFIKAGEAIEKIR